MLRVLDQVEYVYQVHVELVELTTHGGVLLVLLAGVVLDTVYQALFDQLLALVLGAFGEGYLRLALLDCVELVLVLLGDHLTRLQDHLHQVLQPLYQHALDLC